MLGLLLGEGVQAERPADLQLFARLLGRRQRLDAVLQLAEGVGQPHAPQLHLGLDGDLGPVAPSERALVVGFRQAPVDTTRESRPQFVGAVHNEVERGVEGEQRVLVVPSEG